MGQDEGVHGSLADGSGARHAARRSHCQTASLPLDLLKQMTADLGLRSGKPMSVKAKRGGLCGEHAHLERIEGASRLQRLQELRAIAGKVGRWRHECHVPRGPKRREVRLAEMIGANGAKPRQTSIHSAVNKLFTLMLKEAGEKP